MRSIVLSAISCALIAGCTGTSVNQTFGSIESVSDKTFSAEVLNAKEPVLVDFTASWCGPCRMQAPVVRSFARENRGKLKVVSVDIDQNPEIAQRLGIGAIPTLVVFKNGRAVQAKQGYTDKRGLASLVQSAM